MTITVDFMAFCCTELMREKGSNVSMALNQFHTM